MSIGRNTALNLAGLLVPIAVQVATVPPYLRAVGAERYGVLALAWLLLVYFGLVNLGLGRAVAQRVATARDARGQADAVATAALLSLGLGLLGGVALWLLVRLAFAPALDAAPGLRAEMRAAAPWLVPAVPILTLGAVMAGALQGSGRFFALNAAGAAATTLSQVLPLAAAHLIGPQLAVLMPAVLAGRALGLAGMGWAWAAGAPVAGRPSRAEARAMLGFGAWSTVSSAIGPLMTALDRFVIAHWLGPTAVTHYTIPAQLAQMSTSLAGTLAGALFPRLAVGAPAERRALAGEAMAALAALATLPFVAAVLLAEPILALWISDPFAAEAAPVLRILLVGFWANALSQVPINALLAAGRADRVALCHAAELPGYLALLAAGLWLWGLPGVAAAFSVRVAADLLALSAMAGLGREALRLARLPLPLLAATAALAPRLGPGGSWAEGALAIAAVAAAAALSATTAPPGLRRALSRVLSRTLPGRLPPARPPSE